MNFLHDEASAVAAGGGPVAAPPQGQAGAASMAEKKPFIREGKKVGRNEPCPCGSGKKYKQCHGKIQ